MKYGRITLLTAVMILLFSHTDVSAGKSFDWEAITSEDWGVAPDSSKKIFDAAIIFEKVVADDKRLQKGDVYRTVYRRIRILGPSGREWADVDVPFMHRRQKVKNVFGRTVLRDGTEIPLTEENIFEKEKVRTKDIKFKQKTFSLPGVTDDCIVEYVIEYELPTAVQKWVVQQDIPVLRAELRWIIAEFKVAWGLESLIEDFVTPNYLWLNTISDPKLTQLPNIKEPKVLVFEIGYVPPFEEHPHTIPDAAQMAKLYCYYGSRKSPAAYWGDYSVRLDADMQDFCEKNKRVRELVKSWSGLEDDQIKIETAYYWIQDNILNLTYLTLYDERGKEQEPKALRSVDDIIKYGYGDREEICLLFCDMLREMNIDARIAYLKDRYDDLFVPEAKYWQMDQALVAVAGTSDAVTFYSPGDVHSSLDMVPWDCEGVDALVCGSNKYLVPVPFSTFQQTVSNVSYEFTVNENREVCGHLEARFGGHDGRSARLALTDEDSTDFTSLLKGDLAEFVPLAEIDSLGFDKLDSCTVAFRLNCHLKYPSLSKAGSRILLKPLEYMSSVENPFTDPERSIPILFNYAHQLNESVRLKLPENYAIEGLPNDTTYENGIGRCSVKFQQMGGELVAQRFFTLNAPYWSAIDYPAIKALFQARMDMSGQIVMLAQSSETGGEE